MKYLKYFESNFDNSKVYVGSSRPFYWIINIDKCDDSFKKLKEITGFEVYFSYNFKSKVREKFKSPYVCISYAGGWGYMPLVDITVKKNDSANNNYYYGADFYKQEKYKFGGYINCTRKEVNDFLKTYEVTLKYNV